MSFLTLVLGISSFFPVSLALASDFKPVVLDTPAHIYAPNGFDTNDNAQVVIQGYMPNLCYKAPSAEVKTEGTTIKITMKAFVAADGLCAMAIVPFLETVDLGTLPQGNYTVIVNEGGREPDTTTIKIDSAARSNVDDHVYAMMESIQKFPSSRKVTLHGYNTSDCFVFDRFEVVSNGKDTYSVLPIMKQIHQLCPMKLTPLVLLYEVPETLAAKEILLHVRTMNGESISTTFDNTTRPNR